MLKNNLLVTVALLLVLGSQSTIADQYHYNNILIGNRATGLAGSYVAISDDPSGLYYNPSGIVYSASSNITANMNAYNIGRTKYVAALKSSTGKNVDWIRTSSALVPNFFGITQPLGPGTIGFSYAITDSILEDQGQTFYDIRQAGTKYTINFNNQDVTNNVGPSYAISIGDNFSIGLTLYAYFRTQERIFNQIYQLPNDGQVIVSNAGEANETSTEQAPFFIANQYLSLSEYGVKPILGMSYTPFSKLSLGLSVSQVFLLNSTIEQQDSSASNICVDDSNVQSRCANTQPSSFYLINQTYNGKNSFPWQVNVGAAYFYSNRLMLTANAWVYEAVNLSDRPLVNVAGGLEFYITGKFAVRMGAYTNLANTPKLVPNTVNVHNEHLDIIGSTLSFTHFTRSSAISVGAAGTYGRGKAQIAGGTNIQDVRYMGMSVFLSASNSF